MAKLKSPFAPADPIKYLGKVCEITACASDEKKIGIVPGHFIAPQVR